MTAAALKTCRGPCGLAKPRTLFYRRGDGWVSSSCKECECARSTANAKRRGERGQVTALQLGFDLDGLTLEECAARLGITPRRAQQIESRALFKMRKEAERLRAEGW